MRIKVLPLLLCAVLLFSCADQPIYVLPESNQNNDGSANSYMVENFTYTEGNDPAVDRGYIGLYSNQLHCAIASITDGMLYFTATHRNADPNLYRLDTETGRITYVCPDPLCEYKNQSCPFFGACSPVYIDDNNVMYYIIKYTAGVYSAAGFLEGMENTHQLCAYDMTTGRKRIVYEYEFSRNSTNVELFSGGFYYWYDFIKNEETGKTDNSLCRTDLSNGKTTVLTGTADQVFADVLLFILDGKLYMSDRLTCIYRVNAEDFSGRETVLELDNRKSYVKAKDNEIIILTPGEEGSSVSLYSPVEGILTELVSIEEYMNPRTAFTENYMYYTIKNKGTTIQVGEDQKLIDGQEVYRIRLHGDGAGEPEKVFAFDEQHESFKIQDKFIADDNYLYFYYSSYGEKKERYEKEDFYYSVNDYAIMRADLTTGDLLVITPPEK